MHLVNHYSIFHITHESSRFLPYCISHLIYFKIYVLKFRKNRLAKCGFSNLTSPCDYNYPEKRQHFSY